MSFSGCVRGFFPTHGSLKISSLKTLRSLFSIKDSDKEDNMKLSTALLLVAPVAGFAPVARFGRQSALKMSTETETETKVSRMVPRRFDTLSVFVLPLSKRNLIDYQIRLSPSFLLL